MPKQTTADILRAASDVSSEACPVSCQNVGEIERIASVGVGTALAVAGVTGIAGGSWKGVLAFGAGAALIYRGASGWCGLYEMLGIDGAHHADESHAGLTSGEGIRVEKSATIAQPVADVYRFWRALRNLPQVMSHLESVHETDQKHSHWIAKGPLGVNVEWDAEIIEERTDELIAWQSVGESEIATAGSVRFQATPDGKSTVVRVLLRYSPPGGKLGAAVAKLLGEDPEQQIDADLTKYAAKNVAGDSTHVEPQTTTV